MADGFKTGEVECTCGETFGSISELIAHASSAHGVEVE